jgi:hypothetical protein
MSDRVEPVNQETSKVVLPELKLFRSCESWVDNLANKFNSLSLIYIQIFR